VAQKARHVRVHRPHVENRIDISVLPDLTDQQLKDLGIALRDRLKMLRMIRDLASAAVAVTASVTRGDRADEGRRRRAPPADL
jgi:hypothetical protein